MEGASESHDAHGDYRTESFIEDSRKKPLYQFQSSLPRLPVPTLEETLSRYLMSAKAISTPKEYEYTLSAVREFLLPGGLVSRYDRSYNSKVTTLS